MSNLDDCLAFCSMQREEKARSVKNYASTGPLYLIRWHVGYTLGRSGRARMSIEEALVDSCTHVHTGNVCNIIGM